MEYTEREKELVTELQGRGFRIDMGVRDGNNVYSLRQQVKLAGVPGCFLLNGVLVRDKHDGTYPMLGSIQVGKQNKYYPIDTMRPAKRLEFYIQPDGFGQTSWKAFWAIIGIGVGGATGASYGLGSAWWMLLSLLSVGGLVWMTERNFTRRTA